MRAVTVFGMVALGAGLGSAALLTPLLWRDATPPTPPRAAAPPAPSTPPSYAAAGFADGAAQRAIPAPARPDSPTAASPEAPSAAGDSAIAAAPPSVETAPIAPRVAAAVAPWAAQVTVTPNTGGGRVLPPVRPTSATGRVALVRDLQRELERVGCYSGEIDGDWGGSSKRAMLAFLARVNAALPSTDPDQVLLSLVKGHRTVVCGADCPTGQAQNSAGQCVPKSVLAQGTRPKPSVASKPAAAPSAVATAEPGTDGRQMARQTASSISGANNGPASKTSSVRERADRPVVIATSPPSPVPASRSREPSGAVAGTRTTLAEASPSPTPLPWAASTPPLGAAPEPLPGRMSVGGPLPPSAPATGPAADGRGPPGLTGGIIGGTGVEGPKSATSKPRASRSARSSPAPERRRPAYRRHHTVFQDLFQWPGRF